MRALASLCVTILVAIAGCAALAPEQKPRSPMVVTAFEDAKFVAIAPGRPDSPEIAVLWGDPRTGPSAMFIRLKKGLIPMHTHVSDYHLVVLQGQVKHWSEDQTAEDAKLLGPGSYWFQPANEPHADDCLSDECLVHIVWGGRQEGRLVEPRKK